MYSSNPLLSLVQINSSLDHELPRYTEPNYIGLYSKVGQWSQSQFEAGINKERSEVIEKALLNNLDRNKNNLAGSRSNHLSFCGLIGVLSGNGRFICN